MCSNNLNYLQNRLGRHVFTTFDAHLRNVKCKNKNVLEVLKSSKYISRIYFEDFKTSRTFLFLHFVYVRRM